mmetsp:Transcript_22990/g.49750  ORF Transcript_22990/g.49750 Transcript_22990/m.49750 type:complete len:259 (+) Transcript_22990:210-986(+)
MCQPISTPVTPEIRFQPTSTPATREIRRVVIAGASPAGLHLQALLHTHNKAPDARVTYDVTLIESRPDLGQLDQDDLQSRQSCMTGLAGNGLEAIRSIPTLYENYVSGIGIPITEGNMFISPTNISTESVNKNESDIPDSFIVDRNFIVAAFARYAKDNIATGPNYTCKYETEVLYVDSENHRVLIRDKASKEEEYLEYDLLVGADGVCSTAREALVKCHFDFELEVSDISATFKAVDIVRGPWEAIAKEQEYETELL